MGELSEPECVRARANLDRQWAAAQQWYAGLSYEEFVTLSGAIEPAGRRAREVLRGLDGRQARVVLSAAALVLGELAVRGEERADEGEG